MRLIEITKKRLFWRRTMLRRKLRKKIKRFSRMKMKKSRRRAWVMRKRRWRLGRALKRSC